MEQIAEWTVRGVVGALVAGGVALFARLRAVENTQSGYAERIKTLEGGNGGSIDDVRHEVKELRLLMEREFVRREEWVPHVSRILGALEEQGRQLARLDERLKARS